jgi:hypothetical protein
MIGKRKDCTFTEADDLQNSKIIAKAEIDPNTGAEAGFGLKDW